MADKMIPEDRNIRAVFYKDFQARTALKVNKGKHPERMVLRCIAHMRKNTYEAVLAEVFNDNTGKLHAVVKRRINGDVEILFQEEFKPENKI